VSESGLAIAGDKLDGFAALETLVCNALPSPGSRRMYRQGLRDFFSWYETSSHLRLTRNVILEYVRYLEGRDLAASTLNLRLAAIRKMVRAAAESGMLDRAAAVELASVRNVPAAGIRVGKWLDPEEVSKILAAPDVGKLKGKRDRALLGVLIVCGLRRDELVRLTVEHMQKRSRRWLIVDIQGKGNRVRTVALPAWVKEMVDTWAKASGIRAGKIFRAVHKSGAVKTSLSTAAVWQIVQGYGGKCELAPLSPHDLRRTCAKLCRAAGGDLEQIQYLLGHESIQTTERYLGGKQELVNAVNDRIVVDSTR